MRTGKDNTRYSSLNSLNSIKQNVALDSGNSPIYSRPYLISDCEAKQINEPYRLMTTTHSRLSTPTSALLSKDWLNYRKIQPALGIRQRRRNSNRRRTVHGVEYQHQPVNHNRSNSDSLVQQSYQLEGSVLAHTHHTDYYQAVENGTTGPPHIYCDVIEQASQSQQLLDRPVEVKNPIHSVALESGNTCTVGYGASNNEGRYKVYETDNSEDFMQPPQRRTNHRPHGISYGQYYEQSPQVGESKAPPLINDYSTEHSVALAQAQELDHSGLIQHPRYGATCYDLDQNYATANKSTWCKEYYSPTYCHNCRGLVLEHKHVPAAPFLAGHYPTTCYFSSQNYFNNNCYYEIDAIPSGPGSCLRDGSAPRPRLTEDRLYYSLAEMNHVCSRSRTAAEAIGKSTSHTFNHVPTGGCNRCRGGSLMVSP